MFLKELDIFDKFSIQYADFTTSTKIGRSMSFVFTLIGIIIFINQYFALKIPIHYRDLLVDQKLIDVSDLINVSLSIQIAIPCYYLHVDVVDHLGNSQLNINNTLQFKRYTKANEYIGINNESLHTVCFPCFGLFTDKECCNDCESIMQFASLRRPDLDPSTFPQCQKENLPKHDESETCLIEGSVAIPKTRGQIHIVPGRNVKSHSNNPEESHTHDLSDVPRVGLPHTINLVRFGPESRFGQPRLRRIIERNEDESNHRVYRYNVIATKVLYFVDSVPRGFSYDTYVFTTHHYYSSVFGYEPGIYFEYDVTPYEVAERWIARDRLQLIVTSAGFLAGAFALVSALEGLLQLAPRAAGQPQVLRNLKKKREQPPPPPEEPKEPMAEFPSPEEVEVDPTSQEAPQGENPLPEQPII